MFNRTKNNTLWRTWASLIQNYPTAPPRLSLNFIALGDLCADALLSLYFVLGILADTNAKIMCNVINVADIFRAKLNKLFLHSLGQDTVTKWFQDRLWVLVKFQFNSCIHIDFSCYSKKIFQISNQIFKI